MFACPFSRRYLKKLSYSRGTARRAMLVNTCRVSRAMEVIKVSNRKSDLQGHSRALQWCSLNYQTVVRSTCTMSLENSFILGSKGHRSRSQRLCRSLDKTQYCRCVRKPCLVFPACFCALVSAGLLYFAMVVNRLM